MNIEKNLQNEFNKINAKFKIISNIHIKKCIDEIENLKQSKQISKKYYNRLMSNFNLNRLKNLNENHSIIIIGIPQKITIVEFQKNKIKYNVVIPPSYIYREDKKICIDILSKVLNEKIHPAYIPLKMLAVHSGLGKYGRNNICYIKGMGSFLRLEGFYIDYPISIDNWQEKQIMKICRNCNICIKSCPHNCIKDNNFLINAEQCLTYFNEYSEDFPEWIRDHNALVGCMRCQINCPMNKDFISLKKRDMIFSEEETNIILRGFKKDDYRKEVYKKIRMLNMDDYKDLLPRNLNVLINLKNRV